MFSVQARLGPREGALAAFPRAEVPDQAAPARGQGPGREGGHEAGPIAPGGEQLAAHAQAPAGVAGHHATDSLSGRPGRRGQGAREASVLVEHRVAVAEGEDLLGEHEGVDRLALAHTVASRAQVSLRGAKTLVERAATGRTEEEESVLDLYHESWTSPEYAEGVAAFLAKRSPDFRAARQG